MLSTVRCRTVLQNSLSGADVNKEMEGIGVSIRFLELSLTFLCNILSRPISQVTISAPGSFESVLQRQCLVGT